MRVTSLVKIARMRRATAKLRAAMRAMETAAIANDLVSLYQHACEQTRISEGLRHDNEWKNEEVLRFLSQCKTVKSLRDPDLEAMVAHKVEQAERIHGHERPVV